MARNILILGASYGSLLATKLLMAGHHVTLVCRKKTAELINRDGTEVRIKLRDEAMHRAIFSRDLPGTLDATSPQDIDLSRYDLVALAMQEPQYANHTIRVLMIKIAEANLPCLSIMNMPPLPYLKRIPGLADMDLEEAYTNAQVWERFKPGLVSLCSPDPQAFRPPEEAANVLHVGLPTNFKASTFADEAHNLLLRELEADIDAVKLDGQEVPVKLKVFDSLFVPLAKWSMLLTGNYRCITPQDPQSIRDAVHGDVPNPWVGVTMKSRVKLTKPAVTREQVYEFALGCIERGEPECGAAAVICFEWLQRPENVVAGHIKWSGYRTGPKPTIQVEHHKTGAIVNHPLEEKMEDGTVVKFYADAETILSHLSRRGMPMILREFEDGKAKPYSFSGMQKIVQRMRKKIGLPVQFTLDACRHGGMTELEESDLTDGQGRALSAHRTHQTYAGYAKRTEARMLSATRKRHAHRLANQLATSVQNEPVDAIQNENSGTARSA